MIPNFVTVSSLAISETKAVDLNSESNGSVQNLYYAFFSIEEVSQFSVLSL